MTDTQSGMQMLGARYYLPALGRFLTQDPIGHKGGLNLYAYADNNPLNKVDPTGLKPPTERQLMYLETHLDYTTAANPIESDFTKGWNYGMGVFVDWTMGLGASERSYGANSFQTTQMRESAAGDYIRQWAAEHNYRGGSSVGTFRGFALTASDMFNNGTEAQVGGFGFSIHRNLNNSYYTVRIDNVVSFNSFFAHAPAFFGVQYGWDGTYNRFNSGFGPMGNLTQRYQYNEQIK